MGKKVIWSYLLIFCAGFIASYLTDNAYGLLGIVPVIIAYVAGFLVGRE